MVNMRHPLEFQKGMISYCKFCGTSRGSPYIQILKESINIYTICDNEIKSTTEREISIAFVVTIVLQTMLALPKSA